MAQYSKEEIKTGSFVLIALTAFLFLLFMVGAFRTTAGTYSVQVSFNFISGLETGAPVRFAGHEVGKVRRLEIQEGVEKGHVIVTLSVKDKVVLREDSKAYIDTLGLMGEKYIEITPGSISSSRLELGALITGEDPVAIYELTNKMMSVVDKVDTTLVVMEELLKNSNEMLVENRNEIKVVIENLEEISHDAKSLTKDLRRHPWKLLRKHTNKIEGEEDTSKTSSSRKRFLGIF